MCLILIICIFLVGTSTSTSNISFKEVTIAWTLDNGSDGTKYVLSSNSLKENLPNTYFKIAVSVKNGSVPVLYQNSVSDIENLETLTLSSVALKEIRPGAFRNLPKLRKVVIMFNSWEQIKGNTFSNLELNSLHLNFNLISSILKGAFKNLQVKDLWLSNNKISKLSRGIFENVEINTFTLKLNQISEIEAEAFTGLKVSKLNLVSNKLEEINPEVFNVPDLKHLDLENNKIKTVRAGDLQNLPKLEVLRLSENKLKTIEEGTFRNSILKQLYLDSNEISSIPPRSFNNMTKLVLITAQFNNLTEWNKNWFYNTPNLRNVKFGHNQIKEILDGAFQNFDKLEDLDLSGNEISKFSPKAFVKNEGNKNGKVKVSYLSLDGNKLTCIEEEAFGSVKLVILNLNPWDKNCKNTANIIANE